MGPGTILRFQKATEAVDRAEDADTISEILTDLLEIPLVNAVHVLGGNEEDAAKDLKQALYRNINTPPHILFNNSFSKDWETILSTPLIPFYIESQDDNLFVFIGYHYLYVSQITLKAAQFVDTHYTNELFIDFWERKLKESGAAESWLPIPRPTQKLAKSKGLSNADLNRWDKSLKDWYKKPPYSNFAVAEDVINTDKAFRDTIFIFLSGRSADYRMAVSSHLRSKSFPWRMNVHFFSNGESRQKKLELPMLAKYVAFLREFYEMLGEEMPTHALADILSL